MASGTVAATSSLLCVGRGSHSHCHCHCHCHRHCHRHCHLSLPCTATHILPLALILRCLLPCSTARPPPKDPRKICGHVHCPTNNCSCRRSALRHGNHWLGWMLCLISPQLSPPSHNMRRNGQAHTGRCLALKPLPSPPPPPLLTLNAGAAAQLRTRSN